MSRKTAAANEPWEFSFVGSDDAYSTILSYVIANDIGLIALDSDFDLFSKKVALGLDLSFDKATVSAGSNDVDLMVKVPLYDGYLYFPGMAKGLAGTSFDFSVKFGDANLQFEFAPDNSYLKLTATKFDKSGLDLAINSTAPAALRNIVIGVFKLLERTVWQLLPHPARIWLQIPFNDRVAGALTKIWALSSDGCPKYASLSTPSTEKGPGVGISVIAAGKYKLPLAPIRLQDQESFSAAASSSLLMQAYVLPALTKIAQQFWQNLPSNFFQQNDQNFGWTCRDWIVCDPIAQLCKRPIFAKYADELAKLQSLDSKTELAFKLDAGFSGNQISLNAQFRLKLHDKDYGEGVLIFGVATTYDLTFGKTKDGGYGLNFTPSSIKFNNSFNINMSFFQAVYTAAHIVGFLTIILLLVSEIIFVFGDLIKVLALGAGIIVIFDPSLIKKLIDGIGEISDWISRIAHAIELVNYTQRGGDKDIKGIIDQINGLGILKDKLAYDSLSFSFDMPADAFLVAPTRLSFSNEIRVFGSMALPVPPPAKLPVPATGMVPIYHHKDYGDSPRHLYSQDPDSPVDWTRLGRAFFAYSIPTDGMVDVYQSFVQDNYNRSCWVYYLDGGHGTQQITAFYASATPRDGFVPVRRYTYSPYHVRAPGFTYHALSTTRMEGWDEKEIVFYAPHA